MYFPLNSYKIEKEVADQVNSLIRKNALKPGQKLTILGYADNAGTTRHNDTLSLNRAQHVGDYLTAKGFDKADIKLCVGRGEIEHGTSRKEHATDRKVQIVAEHTEQKKVAKPRHVAGIDDMILLNHVQLARSLEKVVDTSFGSIVPLAEFLKNNPTYTMQIEGYARGNLHTKDSSYLNNGAEQFYDQLLANGFDKKRLSYKEMGNVSSPVDEHMFSGKGAYRLVILRIVGK